MGWAKCVRLFPAIAGMALTIGMPMKPAPTLAAETYTAQVFTQDGAYVLAVAFSGDGSLVAIAEADGPVHVKDTASGADKTVLKGDGSQLNLLALSPDGSRVVTVSADNMIRVWAIAASQEVSAFKADHPVNSIAFSADGKRLIDGGSDGAAHVWDIETGRPIAVLGPNEGDVVDAALNADGTLAVTSSVDNTARVWDVAGSRQILLLQHTEPVLAAAISPDNARIVTGTADGTARIFDAANGAELAVLKGHEREILHATYSADGSRIATASVDDTARVWDANGAQIATLSGHLGHVYHVAFSPDGARVFTAGRDATGRIWTRAAAASLSAGIEGLWYQKLAEPEAMPAEAVQFMCMANPAMVHPDGLVVFFSGSDTSVPEAIQHLRCGSDLKCQMYPGAPAQGLEAFGEAELSFTGDAGALCMQGDCMPIARCPALVWTDEQRASGFAEKWEARVMAGPQ